ncbi:hypothetical protein EVAR_46467_1 [Eumeta japonica]|uniref:Uncharacterized protein n=1 Tax=Eumeta variegata TaxID=151549 RepID=A0A4C1XGT5_EUMVA|nr:hypothetical protein EVAR_46467_1 [Eumeta japonica]
MQSPLPRRTDGAAALAHTRGAFLGKCTHKHNKKLSSYKTSFIVHTDSFLLRTTATEAHYLLARCRFALALIDITPVTCDTWSAPRQPSLPINESVLLNRTYHKCVRCAC